MQIQEAIRTYPIPAAAKSTPASQHSNWAVGMVLLPVFTVILLNLFAQQDLDGLLRFTASGVVVLGWIPFVIHVIRRREGLPLMPLLALIYGVYYGWTIFLEQDFMLPGIQRLLPDGLLVQAEMTCFIGIVCMIVGYYIFPERSLKAIPRVEITTSLESMANSAVVAGLLAAFITRIDSFVVIPARLSAIFAALSQLMVFCIGVLFYTQLKGRLKPQLVFVLWGVLAPFRFLASLTSGAVGQVIYDAIVMLGVYWVAKRKWPWRTGMLFAFFVIPMLGVKGEYRKQVWFATENYNTLEKAQIFFGLMRDGFLGQEGFVKDSLETSVQRIDQTITLCAVMNLTPSVIPYWGGDSYSTLYWMFIPRLLYPDKPLKVMGQDFGHRYGLLGKSDRTTSYNLPQLVELYVNFGTWGVVLGMFLIGMICRWLFHVFSSPVSGDAGKLLAVVVFSRLCNIESDFSLVFGGLFLQILTLALMVRLMNTRKIHMPLDAFRFR
jgi:hypothetical protein